MTPTALAAENRAAAVSPPRVAAPSTLFPALLWVQGLYYLVTGAWPLVSIETFQMVTGPKTDHWLVVTVGVLITAIAVALLVAAWRRRNPPEIAVLAIA